VTTFQNRSGDKFTVRGTMRDAEGIVARNTRRLLALSVVWTTLVGALAIIGAGIWIWVTAENAQPPPIIEKVFLLLFGAAGGAMATYGVQKALERPEEPKP